MGFKFLFLLNLFLIWSLSSFILTWIVFRHRVEKSSSFIPVVLNLGYPLELKIIPSTLKLK